MTPVILNTASGHAGRSGVRVEIERAFAAAGLQVRTLEVHHPAELGETARAAVAAGASRVVAAGGDGTVAAVAAALAGTAVPLGVLPLGTLNHFAKAAGVPLALDAAARTVARGRERRVDVGRVNGRVFLNNVSLGVYPDIVEWRERLREKGRTKWVAFVLATAGVLRRDREVSIRLAAGNTRIVARTPFVFVGNNEYQVEGIGMGARQRLDAGLLFAYYGPPVHTRELPRLVLRALTGRARRNRVLECLQAKELWIDGLADSQMQVACDGELVVMRAPLHVTIDPRALTVMVPGD